MVQNYRDNPKIHRDLQYLLEKLKDIRPILDKLHHSTILDEVELYMLKIFALKYTQIRDLVQALKISLKELLFPPVSSILSLLDPDCLGIPTFQIYSSYSPLLYEIRERKTAIEEQIFEISHSFNSSAEIDDASSLFQDLKSKRNQIVLEEQNEILKVRKNLTQNLEKYRLELHDIISSLGYFDFLRAKARMAIDLGAVLPKISSTLDMALVDMINPYVQSHLSQKGKHFTPISLNVSQGITILTGANMGGKTVSLYTLLLNVLLAQCGCFVCAKSATIPIFEFIGTILQDDQSISQGLSSFGAEIVRLNRYLESYENQEGLLIIDEFARGTNPKEGRILFRSVCNYLNQLPWIGILSTHYDGVADTAMTQYQVIGLQNVDFSHLSQKLSNTKQKTSPSVSLIQDLMDYRLQRVTEETIIPHDAMNIAKILGLNTHIIAHAQKLSQLEHILPQNQDQNTVRKDRTEKTDKTDNKDNKDNK